MSKWWEFAFAWLPFVVVIGVWLWVGRKNGFMGRNSSGAGILQLTEQQIAETRRMNSILERIADTLDKRSSETSSR